MFSLLDPLSCKSSANNNFFDQFSSTNLHRYLVCLTIAPAFISATIYLCLARLIVVYGPHLARFSPRFYTITFICCDVLSLVLQAAGGGLAATGDAGSSSQQAGVNVMIAGLAFQVVSMTLFMALSIDFIISVRRAAPAELNSTFTELRSSRMFSLFPWGKLSILQSRWKLQLTCCSL